MHMTVQRIHNRRPLAWYPSLRTPLTGIWAGSFRAARRGREIPVRGARIEIVPRAQDQGEAKPLTPMWPKKWQPPSDCAETRRLRKGKIMESNKSKISKRASRKGLEEDRVEMATHSHSPRRR